MRVLWITNIPIDTNRATVGGWMSSLYSELVADESYEIFLATNGLKTEHIGKSYYYSYSQENFIYPIKLKKEIKKIVEEIDPDIIHIWGTEFYHTYAATLALKETKRINKTIISLQGIMDLYAKAYRAGCPFYVVLGLSIKDLYKKTAIWYQKLLFYKRGIFEKKALRLVENVLGRTQFDYNYSLYVNNHLNYFYCGEVLRREFFENQKWDIQKAENNRLFVSQASYPIKAFHKMLEALVIIKKQNPKIKLYVGGTNVYYKNYPLWKLNSYEKYIIKYIEKYNLKDNVEFLGPLSASEMIEQYLKCRVFISPSVIENSSNSIGEAMVLGTPIVSSKVGGVTSQINDRTNGCLYEYSDTKNLATIVLRLLADNDYARELSINEIIVAKKMYNTVSIVDRYKEIYEKVNSGEK